MQHLPDPKPKVPRLQYDGDNLQRAYDATRRQGMSVYRAARLYKVPESTLRDRTRGNVSVDAKIGFETLFTLSEEKDLVSHVKYMADIGYGYNKSELQYMARDYAVSLGKPVKCEKALSNSWFYDFLKRWQDLKVAKPQKLALARAKSASQETIDSYFKELGTILTTNNLHEYPEHIYNVDETGISTEHTPSKIVCRKECAPQSVTSPRSSNVTIIAGGNAIGNHIPPYYIFPGQRWNDDLLQGAAVGSGGEMTKNGWSNSSAFHNYLTKHFAKYANISSAKDGQKTLVLYDGHKSHVRLTLADWAERNNVILFVLPPHSSHITQPLDVAVFGPLKSMYNQQCKAYMKQNPGVSITRYEVAQLTAKPYVNALSPANLVSAFRKTGVHPFDKKQISSEQLAPAIIYPSKLDDSALQVENEKENDCANTVMGSGSADNECPNNPRESTFLQDRTITKVVPRPKRKFVPPFISGNLSKASNLKVLKTTEEKKATKENPCSLNQTGSSKKVQTNSLKSANSVTLVKKIKSVSPKPSTSGLNKSGGAIQLDPEDSQDSDSDVSVSDQDLCCVCKDWQPEELRNCQVICFVTWGQCSFCNHWTHLKYCTPVRVLRSDSIFRCPHCLDKK